MRFPRVCPLSSTVELQINTHDHMTTSHSSLGVPACENGTPCSNSIHAGRTYNCNRLWLHIVYVFIQVYAPMVLCINMYIIYIYVYMIYSLQFHWRSRSPVPSAAHNTSRAEAYQCLILWLSLLLQLRIVLQILGEHEVRLHHQKTRAEGCQLKFWFINSKVCVGSEFAGRSIYRIDQKLIRRDRSLLSGSGEFFDPGESLRANSSPYQYKSNTPMYHDKMDKIVIQQL